MTRNLELFVTDRQKTADIMEWWNLVALLLVGLQYCFKGALGEDAWSVWWSYEQFTGPDYWAINNEWTRCSNGKHQSPVNIDPKSLLFDPKLNTLKVDSAQVNGEMFNTGQDITMYINGSNAANITAGPLSYKYKVDHIKFHFGKTHDEGSEHKIANKSFPAEMQIYGYNTDLYKHFKHASEHSQGLIAIALFIEVGTKPGKEMARISKEFVNVRYKNWTVNIHGLSISSLLPETDGYITYEGSLTQPGCNETVTWIIMNKPIYISKKHMANLRNVRRSENNSANQWDMAGNRRPVKPLHHRAVRTNINFPKRTPVCNMERVKNYTANIMFKGR